MILRPHHALNALAMLRGQVIDVRADGSGADERDRDDVRMAAERIDSALAAVNDVQHARRHTGLERELGQQHGGQRVLFRGLEHEGVAADDGHRKHP
jgi:hypothetical protein